MSAHCTSTESLSGFAPCSVIGAVSRPSRCPPGGWRPSARPRPYRARCARPRAPARGQGPWVPSARWRPSAPWGLRSGPPSGPRSGRRSGPSSRGRRRPPAAGPPSLSLGPSPAYTAESKQVGPHLITYFTTFLLIFSHLRLGLVVHARCSGRLPSGLAYTTLLSVRFIVGLVLGWWWEVVVVQWWWMCMVLVLL